ncbi:MAG: stage III sporulation protein AE [Monoglobales bacterium]
MKKIILVLVIVLLGFQTSYAFGTDEIISKQLELSGADEIYINDEISFSGLAKDLISFDTPSPESILSVFFAEMFEAVKESISLCLFVILIVVVLNIITNAAGKDAAVFDLSFYVCYMVVFMMGAVSFKTATEIARTSIDELNFFMKAAVPVLGTLMTASGGIVRTTLIGVSIIAITTTVSAISTILFPVSTMSALISGVGGLNGDNSLKGFSTALKKASVWGLGIITTIFTTILSTRSFAAVNLDNVTGKTVKYAAGTFVPVVGGMLSETLESIIACGRLVKGAAGGASVIVLLYLCLSPIIKLVAIIVAYKFTAMVIAPVSDGRLSTAIEEFTSAIVIILAMVIFTAVMFIICAGIIAAI